MQVNYLPISISRKCKKTRKFSKRKMKKNERATSQTERLENARRCSQRGAHDNYRVKCTKRKRTEKEPRKIKMKTKTSADVGRAGAKRASRTGKRSPKTNRKKKTNKKHCQSRLLNAMTCIETKAAIATGRKVGRADQSNSAEERTDEVKRKPRTTQTPITQR